MKQLLLALFAVPVFASDPAGQPGVVRSEFIFETAPFPSCHASTIAETNDGLVAAWFGGTKEGAPDVGIWLSRQRDGHWTAPVEVANGVRTDGQRFACFNPVLFQPTTKVKTEQDVEKEIRKLYESGKTSNVRIFSEPARDAGPLLLFYKTGGLPSGWAAFLKTSTDEGVTWSTASPLPEGFVGPVKNKPVPLSDGTLLCGASIETAEKLPKWCVQFERTADLGKTSTKTGFLNDGLNISAIQPSILSLGGDKLLAIGRTRQSHLFRITSDDAGKTWSAMTLSDLPNPNSGTDAVTLRDGRHLLVYNHTTKGRSPLNVAVSTDGLAWQAALTLESEPGEYSYPAIIQTRDGLVHAVYTWKRQRIKHVVIDPAKLVLRAMPDGQWPK
jgi:predicted neuraminidase